MDLKHWLSPNRTNPHIQYHNQQQQQLQQHASLIYRVGEVEGGVPQHHHQQQHSSLTYRVGEVEGGVPHHHNQQHTSLTYRVGEVEGCVAVGGHRLRSLAGDGAAVVI